MTLDSSDFISQGSDDTTQWSRETKYFLLTSQQEGGRLLLRKSLKSEYLDNDKNYTVNLHFRGQSDSDPEVWIGVDVDPDHTGDLDEEDDSNE